MQPLPATMREYRAMLANTLTKLRSATKYTPAEVEKATREYRLIFGIVDAMTPAERESPLDVIDSGRMRRIAKGAGAADRDVLRVLISFDQYAEQIARMNHAMRRSDRGDSATQS